MLSTQIAFLIAVATVACAQLIDPTATTIDNIGSGLTGSGGGALAAPTTLLSPASGYGGSSSVPGAANYPYYGGSGYGSGMYSPYVATSTPYGSGYGSSATYSPYYGGAGGYGSQLTPYMCCSVQYMPSGYPPYKPYAPTTAYSPYTTSPYYATNNNNNYYQPQQQQLPYMTSSPSYVNAQPYESGLTTTGYASQPLHPYFCIPICGGSQHQSYGGYGSGYGLPTPYSAGYGYGAQSGYGNGYGSSYGSSSGYGNPYGFSAGGAGGYGSPYGTSTGAYGSPYNSVYGSPNSYYGSNGYGGGSYSNNNNNNYYGSGVGGFSPLSSDFGSGGYGSQYGALGGFPRRATSAAAASTRALKSGVKAASTTASRNSRIVTKN